MSGKLPIMKLTFLGTGTSTGVPQLRCGCPACVSSDMRDKRLRTSALVETQGKRILIDCGPDFREQMLRHGRRSSSDYLDALLVTHQHYDHVGGIDDLRPYCYIEKKIADFPVYCQQDVARDLRARLPYSFKADPYPGAPRFDLREIKAYEPFDVDGIEVLPVRVNHYILDILGFKIGNLGYITDAKVVPDATVEALRGVDTLVVNALRRRPHMSHMSLDEALDVVRKINPRVVYLTHISHDMGLHKEVEAILPENVHLACDDMKISIPSCPVAPASPLYGQ